MHTIKHKTIVFFEHIHRQNREKKTKNIYYIVDHCDKRKGIIVRKMGRASSLPLVLIIVLAFSANAVTAKKIVKYLPGFGGELPFTLETGFGYQHISLFPSFFSPSRKLPLCLAEMETDIQGGFFFFFLVVGM